MNHRFQTFQILWVTYILIWFFYWFITLFAKVWSSQHRFVKHYILLLVLVFWVFFIGFLAYHLWLMIWVYVYVRRIIFNIKLSLVVRVNASVKSLGPSAQRIEFF